MLLYHIFIKVCQRPIPLKKIEKEKKYIITSGVAKQMIVQDSLNFSLITANEIIKKDDNTTSIRFIMINTLHNLKINKIII